MLPKSQSVRPTVTGGHGDETVATLSTDVFLPNAVSARNVRGMDRGPEGEQDQDAALPVSRSLYSACARSKAQTLSKPISSEKSLNG